MIGQGYDGAATFSGKICGVYKRIQTPPHVIYIHCSCHRLQLISIQVAASVKEIRIFFVTMTSVWKLFYYSSQKAEALKGIQAVLGFSELKIMKPNDNSCLSHERCIKVICKELPPLLQTLSQLYESSGDAEAYGIYSLLASVNGVSSSYLLSEVLSDLALLNLFMQKKIADFSKLLFMLKSTLDLLNSIRESDTSWCTAAETAISNLETIKGSRGPTVQKSPPLSVQQFRVQVAIPYLATLIANINIRFSGEVVKLVVSASVFNPALPPDDETLLSTYGNSKLSTLANLYREKAYVTFEGVTYSSLAIIKRRIARRMTKFFFKRAVFQKKKAMMEKNTSPPSLQDIKDTMETIYACIFPETLKMMTIFLALPMGTASVERSFSHLK